MASIIESIQNDLQSSQLDYLRILAILFKAYCDNHTSQVNANKALATLNHFSNQLDEAIKASERGEFVECPVDISKYRGDMQKEVLQALENNGIKYTIFTTTVQSKNGTSEIANFLVTEATVRARAVLEAIRTGLDPTINNAKKIVMLDMEVFAQQNSNRRCIMYENLNEQQVNEFKEIARQNNFTFGITNKNGKYAIAITNDVVTRYHLDQFAYECSVFNKSGIVNAMLDLEAINRDNARNKAMENLSQSSNEKTYYVDLSDPSHFVEVSGDTVTVHTSFEPAKTFTSKSRNLKEVLEMEFETVKANNSQMVAIGQKEFMEKYKTTPLDKEALLKFVSDEISLSKYKRHAVMIEQIKSAAEKNINFQPQNSMLKNLEAKLSNLSQNDPNKETLKTFISDITSDNETRKRLLLNGKTPPFMTQTEFNMFKKAMENNLTPVEFVYGTIIVNAERIAMQTKNTQLTALITNNGLDVKKIEQMLTSQDAVGSNFVANENAKLAYDFTKVFKEAVILTSQTELNSNAKYLSNIRNAMVTLKANETILNIAKQAERKRNLTLKQMCTDKETQKELINAMTKIMNGESIEDSGFTTITGMSVKQLTPFIEKALDATSETPNISISQLSKMPFFSTLSEISPLNDIVETATAQDMEVAEKDASYRIETTGDLIAGSGDGEFSLDDMNIDSNTNDIITNELDNYEL
jgi:hypothetical protein